jgi:hypothetical protein
MSQCRFNLMHTTVMAHASDSPLTFEESEISTEIEDEARSLGVMYEIDQLACARPSIHMSIQLYDGGHRASLKNLPLANS